MGISTTFARAPSLKAKKVPRKGFRHRKSVRFGPDQKLEFQQDPLVQDIKDSLWWNREERQDILKKNQFLSRRFRQSDKGKVQRLKHILDSLEYDNDDSDDDSDCEEEKIKMPLHIRGLEYTFLSLKRIRKAHVRKVLQAQEESLDLSVERRDWVLSKQSLVSSKTCRLLARMMGAGDAIKEEPVLRRNRCRMLPTWP